MTHVLFATSAAPLSILILYQSSWVHEVLRAKPARRERESSPEVRLDRGPSSTSQ